MSLERLVLVGLNHISSPVRRRERTAVSKDQLPAALREAAESSGLEEAVLLSTCSRLEIIGVSRKPAEAARSLKDWLERRGGAELAPCLYAKSGEDALLHLFRVTAGLDSWIIGESEIQGQVRRAYQHAFELKRTGRILNRVFQSALAAGKAVRARTGIQTGINSIGGAAAMLAQRLFPGAHDGRVVVFGSGEAAEAVARHLAAKDFQEIWVANRTFERARAVAEPLGGRATTLAEGLRMLASAQAAVFSLGCSQAVLDGAALAPMLAGRSAPLFILDLGLPRNVHEDCAALPQARLYNLDDLKELVRENKDKKSAGKDLAEALAQEAAGRCRDEIIKSAGLSIAQEAL